MDALRALAWAHFEGLWEAGGGEEIPAPDSAWEPLERRWIEFLDAVRERLGSEEKLLLTDPAAKGELLGGLLRFPLADGTVFPSPSPQHR